MKEDCGRKTLTREEAEDMARDAGFDGLSDLLGSIVASPGGARGDEGISPEEMDAWEADHEARMEEGVERLAGLLPPEDALFVRELNRFRSAAEWVSAIQWKYRREVLEPEIARLGGMLAEMGLRLRVEERVLLGRVFGKGDDSSSGGPENSER